MKKQYLHQIEYGSTITLGSIKKHIFSIKNLFFAILLFPLLTSGITNSPLGNVKLTGSFYIYPIGLEGNPYLFDDWKTANILLESGQVAEGGKIKLNIINNDLIFYNEELKRIFIADKATIVNFTINPGSSDSLFFIKYKGDGVGYKLKNNDFIHLLKAGTISFFVKNLADVVNATDVNSKDKVYPKRYYFLQSKSRTVQIALSYGAIYKLFPGKRKEIKKLITTNKLTRSSELNLMKLIDLINQEPSIAQSF